MTVVGWVGVMEEVAKEAVKEEVDWEAVMGVGVVGGDMKVVVWVAVRVAVVTVVVLVA